ncbi:shikimate-5-dehydrogenase [Morchella conica CCBAS932]|uniref:Shikimate-5-dehydrogenase n=1 Tax=Morchella conica CCBAS932 TaxID=1392247 RepID=A0A3N4KNM5_9PEZI|nr:shikimate-5-dehydrogenase [Morchella conica CCBAS932]
MISKLTLPTTDLITAHHAAGKKTYILPLTHPSITTLLPLLPLLSYHTDIFELRVDLLCDPASPTSPPSCSYLKSQLSLLQQATELPIMFTIRTVSQGGKWPDSAHEAALEAMLIAVREGCAYVDVEIEWPQEMIDVMVREKGGSKIVGSFHDWTGDIRWGSEVLREKFERADSFGDIPKLSIMATSIYDAYEQALFLRAHADHPKPILAVAMGAAGQLSRALAPISMITNSLIPSSAPGQLTLAQVHTTMHLAGLLPKRNFFIFGNNIAHSLSPALHNTGFAELGLPHHYSIHETASVDDEIAGMMREETFGGASVTFPHKLQIGKYMQKTSESARLVGAVNTVVVETDPKTGERVLLGDNTDWLGIKSCIEANWPTPGGVSTAAAVVLGAGGAARAACYAVQQLGVRKVYLINRTRSKSDELAADFPALEFEHYLAMSDFPAEVSPVPNILVGCVPADDFVETDIPAQFFSLAAEGGVLVEMAYRPLVTALMKVAGQFSGWKTSRGTDVLKKQAYHQFRMWTGRQAPSAAMSAAVDAVLAKK